MLLPDAIKLRWVHDLVSPSKPGKYFSRYGQRVIVSEQNYETAAAAFAKGAADVEFLASRKDTLNGKTYYLLEFDRVVE